MPSSDVMTDTDLSHRSIARWAADCAERVLGRFEGEHPNDPRPRKAIEAARAWAAGLLPMPMARKAAFAAHAAAREASSKEAAVAARAAGHAAATSHVRTHAPHAAAYALKALANPQAIEGEARWQADRAAFYGLATDLPGTTRRDV